MNRFLTLFALLMLTISIRINAQNPPPKSTQPAAVRAAKLTNDTAIERRLVELALKSPVYRASGHQNTINELELKRAKSSWLNLLSISANYNDQTFAKTSQTATYVYPKYYFGFTIPLGIIFNQPTQVKLAREGLALSKENQEELSRTIKVEILGKYKQYKYYRELLEMQSVIINDVLANAAQAEDNFKKGKISVEEYISSQKLTNNEIKINLDFKLQQDLVKLDIERIIGMPLEQVLR